MYHNFKEEEGSAYARLKMDFDTLSMKFNMITQSGAESKMRKVAKDLLNQELAEAFRNWMIKFKEETNQVKGEAIMKRVGGRMRNKELVGCWDKWFKNSSEGIREMWQLRAARWQADFDTLQMKFDLVTRSGAENIMRNVAKRMIMGEVAKYIIGWKHKVTCDNNQAKGEAIMRRVGGRLKNREISDAFQDWSMNMTEEVNQARGEAIMKRVGGRMRNKELALQWDCWFKNYKGGILDMWRSKFSKTEEKLVQVRQMNKKKNTECGLRLWVQMDEREWKVVLGRLFQEWTRYIATKRRSLLRNRMSGKQRVIGAHIITMIIHSSQIALKKMYIMLWFSLAQLNRTKRNDEYDGDQRGLALVADAQKQARTSAAAILIAQLIHEVRRAQRRRGFHNWVMLNKAKAATSTDNVVLDSDLLYDKDGIRSYPCRHAQKKVGEQAGQCNGVVRMKHAERKKCKIGGVICHACAQFCGCGRSGCGSNNTERKQTRIVDGAVTLDATWCKEQRRWAAMEEEEEDDDGDIFGRAMDIAGGLGADDSY